MKDVQPGDNVTVEGSIEDLTISMIHSRKLNVAGTDYPFGEGGGDTG